MEMVTFPTGRIVWGDLYKANTKDAEGKPLVIKSGPDAGKPTQRFSFGVAIPKGTERHWAETAWGAILWRIGHSRIQTAGQMGEQFAWKVKDGDSAQAGRFVNGKATPAPKDRTGYPGCWVVSFSSTFAAEIYTLCNVPKLTPFPQPGAVNPGDYVQVQASVADNNSGQNPGIYVNPKFVCLVGYGERIVSGGNPDEAGFSLAGVPAGASNVPVGGFSAPAPTPAAAPSQAQYAPPPSTAPAPMAPPAPHTAYMAPPAPGTAPIAPPIAAPAPAPYAPPPAPPAMAGLTPTATATATYQAYRDAGWTDDALIAAGFFVR